MEIGMSAAFPSNVGIVYLAYDPMLTQLGLKFLIDTCKFHTELSASGSQAKARVWTADVKDSQFLIGRRVTRRH